MGDTLKEKSESIQLTNEKIKAPKVQLIDYDGHNVGVVSRAEALQRSQEVGLDLVMLAENGNFGVPVVKVMDFGKALYEKKKKKNEAKKHQTVIQVKEIKISPKIGEHDYQTKMKQMIQFLTDGKRVKITLFFRGRENVDRDDRGGQLFTRIDSTLQQHGFGDNIAQEKDAVAGKLWSRIFYLKNVKTS